MGRGPALTRKALSFKRLTEARRVLQTPDRGFRDAGLDVFTTLRGEESCN
jgi:hypothetical protein